MDRPEKQKKKTFGLFRKKERPETYKCWWRDTFEAIVIAALLALFVRTFAFGTFKIPTGSMEPNLLVGDHLIVNSFILAPYLTPLEKILFPQADVKRGDIVVFRHPHDPNTDFVKRVIGLPGETVEVRGRSVYVDGKKLDEPYAHYIDYSDSYIRENFPPVKIPDNQYFCLGDNRDNSNDSRYWGTVPREMIKGRAFLIYWSYDASTEEYLATGIEQIKNVGKVALNFFSKTRWNRSFKIVN